MYLDPEGAGGKYGFRLQVSAGTKTHMYTVLGNNVLHLCLAYVGSTIYFLLDNFA